MQLPPIKTNKILLEILLKYSLILIELISKLAHADLSGKYNLN